jgi:hypothetical protein
MKTINNAHLIRLEKKIFKFQEEMDFLWMLSVELICFSFLLYILITYRIELFS